MPTFSPRSEPVKKKEELDIRRQVLEDSIRKKLDSNQIIRNAEKYRDTRLLYNKAVLRVIRDKEWQEKPHSYNKAKILGEIELWTGIRTEEIIEEVRRDLKTD